MKEIVALAIGITLITAFLATHMVLDHRSNQIFIGDPTAIKGEISRLRANKH